MHLKTVPLDPQQPGPEARKLEQELRRLIVGQEQAVREIVNIYQVYLAGLNPPGRPIGSFLFLGPTGTGKTRIVEATAQVLLGNPRAVVKIDCAEFQHSHEIAKLIGSPPGYLGHRETPPLLSQENLEQFYTEDVRISFVLFDEIEKASDALWQLLLGILDRATLTLGDNRRVDFSNAMIFMTSNLGAAQMDAILSPRLGFQVRPAEAARETVQQLQDRLLTAGIEAARKHFTPEFFNRIDKIVVFKPLLEEELYQILDLELDFLQEHIHNSQRAPQFELDVSEDARRFLLERGTDIRYGARHLRRTLERYLVMPLANLIASNQIESQDIVRVELDQRTGALRFLKTGKGEEKKMPQPRELNTGQPETIQESRHAAAS